MGDDCNVASHRQSDDSSSSSSPKLACIKDHIKEQSRIGDKSIEEREFLLMASRQSGEPGEGMYKITDNKNVVDNDLSELDEAANIGEPLIFVPPSIVKSAISSFPYSETKLRPDAPSFTPESLTHRSGPASCGIDLVNSDSICLDPIFVPRTIIDDSCFVNVELRSTIDENIDRSTSQMKQQNDGEKNTRDYRESIKEPEFKVIDVTSSPRLKRTIPKLESSIEMLKQANTIENNVVVIAAESGRNEPETRENRPEIEEPRIVRGHWRILRTTFILSNRIQIVVFIASIVICMILVIYVVV